ncbi:MAG: type II toxin-antitoxin system HicB family antitoxin [Candidatus Altiarchaeales archaeon]|nr:type II toxin-antitoxin system HicB family antitoxin [Candidatus Altiarchaeales archaeon]
MKLKVVIEEDPVDGGYIASCPALPGCHSQGETLKDVRENIQDAIQGCLEALNNRVKKKQGTRVIDVAV